jgi:hypothetical protein
MHMVFAADYPFLEIFWTMLIFFGWVIWIWMVIAVLASVFGREDLSGWGKAGWVVFVIVLPFLGVLAYLIINNQEMTARNARTSRAVGYGSDDRSPTGAATGGPAAEIEQAKRLLDNGVVTQEEFEGLKARALA